MMVVGGKSVKRGKWDAYHVYSYQTEFAVLPFELAHVSYFAKPNASPEAMQASGIGDPKSSIETMHPDEFGIRLIDSSKEYAR